MYQDLNGKQRNKETIINRLCEIGVPVLIANSVTFDLGKIMIENHTFSEFEWTVDNFIVFDFDSKYKEYWKLKQPELLCVQFKENQTDKYEHGYYFVDKTSDRIDHIKSIEKPYRIVDSFGSFLCDDLLPIETTKTPIEDRLNRLKGCFESQRKKK